MPHHFKLIFRDFRRTFISVNEKSVIGFLRIHNIVERRTDSRVDVVNFCYSHNYFLLFISLKLIAIQSVIADLSGKSVFPVAVTEIAEKLLCVFVQVHRTGASDRSSTGRLWGTPVNYTLAVIITILPNPTERNIRAFKGMEKCNATVLTSRRGQEADRKKITAAVPHDHPTHMLTL